MRQIVERTEDISSLKQLIEQFPVCVILGPRQCGKTTLAGILKGDHYFDLENPRDLQRFDTPQIALENLEGLIVIDEVQRKPELFPLLRYLVDNNPHQKYLILGSASRTLIKQSSESLAGRVAYYELSGFSLKDIGNDKLNTLWMRGGFPLSYIQRSDGDSLLWRENYIQSFLERDIPQLGITIPSRTLRRFWIMLSHYHGQIMNFSELARSFGISDKTVRSYLEILEGTFMVRLLTPWHANIGKRLVKAPKLYIRDSGIFHSLQTIENMAQLSTHNKLGASWEGFILESVIKHLYKKDVYFWRTQNGAELDLFWMSKGQSWGIEVKYADAPRMTSSIRSCLKDLDPAHIWIIYPGRESYKLEDRVTVLPACNMNQIKIAVS
jgi:uncharacterized protein